MICDKCGSENIDSAVFCSFCGQKMESAAVEKRSSARGKTAVSGSGRTQPIPDRPAPRFKRNVNTYIPRRQRRENMFFDNIDSPDEKPYYSESESRAKRRSLIAGIVLLGVMIYVFWLFILPGGQEYRAYMGWGAPASAYSRLADKAMAEGNVNDAAKYYYDALRLQPDDYGYSLNVAKSMALLGDYNKALSAYAKCITLNPEAVEPYSGVSEIYAKQGDTDRAVNALMTGFNRTGDLTLFRAYKQLKSE